ncbi:hypothetical protein IAR50_006978 [Cryptococcus sp. DSM 104548]
MRWAYHRSLNTCIRLKTALFVCDPFFARLAVIDNEGTIAVECKPPADAGATYFISPNNDHHCPSSFFRVFNYRSLPHSLLLPYSDNPELAKQRRVFRPKPLLDLESFKRFEDTIRFTLASALELTVAAALGKRAVNTPSTASFPAQGDDSLMLAVDDVVRHSSASIEKADYRFPIQLYLSVRRGASPRIDDQDLEPQGFPRSFRY